MANHPIYWQSNNIYVEYSNEVWNWEFPQATANPIAANESVLKDGDPHHLNYDNCSNVGYWAWRRTAYQIKHISDIQGVPKVREKSYHIYFLIGSRYSNSFFIEL